MNSNSLQSGTKIVSRGIGNLRPIGIGTTKRHPLLPDVKTFEEMGIKGIELNNWSVSGVKLQASSPAELTALVQADLARWRQVILAHEIKAE